jgi:hypothetical protein
MDCSVLTTAAAVGDALAGAAAVWALVLWQQQRRRLRRSEVAERALVAINMFSEDLAQFCSRILMIADDELCPLDTEDAQYRYRNELLAVLSEFRTHRDRDLRELEIAHVQARAVLTLDEAFWVERPLLLFALVRSTVQAHAVAICDPEYNEAPPLTAVREGHSELAKIRAAADAVLAPVARYEDAGAMLRLLRRIHHDYARDFAVPAPGRDQELAGEGGAPLPRA